MTMTEWMETNTRHAGKPFSVARYPFQRALLDDLSRVLCCIKCSQVGLTEIQIRKALGICVRNNGVVGIFSLPNESLYKKVSQTRMDPILDSHRVFKDPDDKNLVQSIALKQMGQSFLHVVNATEASATSTSADFLMVDEVDLSNQQFVALFGSRLQNSDMAINQRFSTPTYTGYGIDSDWSVSDQREWACRCAACRHTQVPVFSRKFVQIPGLPNSVDLVDITDEILSLLNLDDARVVCEKCGAPLDLDALDREWIAAYPSRSRRGYRVRPFSTARIGVRYIVEQLLEYKRRDMLRGWRNTVLGEPDESSKARLNEAQIRATLGATIIPSIDKDAPVFLGGDMGQVCHMALGTPTPDGLRVIEMTQVPVDDVIGWVEEVRKTRNLVGGAIDRHPYEPTAEGILIASGGKVFPVEYRGRPELQPVMFKGVENPEVAYFQTNRTMMIDAVAKAVRTGTIRIEGYGDLSLTLVEHLQDMVREEAPEKEATWVKLNGNDHFFHTLGFLILSTKIPDAVSFVQKAEVRSEVYIGGIDMRQFPALNSRGFQTLLP